MSFDFFNDTATTEIYPLSLHDALPIFDDALRTRRQTDLADDRAIAAADDELDGGADLRELDIHVLEDACRDTLRSEEHTSELQSRQYLVCRLLLEKKTEPPRVPLRGPW